MVIKKMRASFGALDGETLCLSDGMNIITLPNEAGKSTWCSFICAMLYGIDTSERDKKEVLSAKNKYRPWNGALMEGSMEILWHGKSVTISRTTKNTASPMQEFSAIYTETGDPVIGITGINAGETLIGMGYDTFLRSAFISQTNMLITQTPELERRIQAVFSTGDERTSYSEADARLREWQRGLRHNKSGRLPALLSEIDELNMKLSQMDENILKASALTEKIQELRDFEKQLEKKLSLHISYEINEQNRHIWTAKKERDKAEAELRDIEKKLNIHGPPPDAGELRENIKAIEVIRTKESMAAMAKAKFEEAAQSLFEYKTQLENSPFNGLSGGEAWDKANAAIAVLRVGDKPAPISKTAYFFAVLFAAAAAVSGFFIGGLIYCALFAGIAVIIDLAVILSARRRTAPSAVNILQRDILISQFETDDPGEILALASKYQALHTAFLDTEAHKNKLFEEYEDILSDINEKKASFTSRTGNFLKNISSLDAAENEINRLLDTYAKAEVLKLKFESADKLYFSLFSAAKQGTISEPDIMLSAPEGKKEQIELELRGVKKELSDTENELAMLKGSFSAFGSPDELKARFDEKTLLKDYYEEEYKAIALCISELSGANNTLRERFSPLLNEHAGRIMEHLTCGRYKKVSFDRNFAALFELDGDVAWRKSPYMSTGSIEQLYLALRIAICEIALGSEEPPPLILDDALVYFDDKRMKRALDYLRTESEKRQIIVFSCQSREGQYLPGALSGGV